MNINDVTLVTIETMYHGLAKRAMEETLKRLPIKNVVVFSDKDFLPGSKFVQIEHGDMFSYCQRLLKGMAEHIDTTHMIFQQWDAMAHRDDGWRDYFLLNDYIGAVWPWRPSPDNVGNGGFSLRSRRLLDELQAPHLQMNIFGEHGVQEDNYISLVWRKELESKGIVYAPSPVADQFSIELSPTGEKAMAHHGLWNIVQFMPRDVVEYFILNIPKNTWNELHRAHHTLVCMAGVGYLDLLLVVAPDVVASPCYKELISWLATDDFPNKDAALKILGHV
jgi:Protein of unknown function (DUF5672)